MDHQKEKELLAREIELLANREAKLESILKIRDRSIVIRDVLVIVLLAIILVGC